MEKQIWKAGNMLYPLPAVMVSCRREGERPNILTVAWTGTVCTNPAMLFISVRPERYSYAILKETGEFVVNLTTEEPSQFIGAPGIKESPVNIECKTTQVLELGSHHMFLAKVLAVHIDGTYLDENGKFHLSESRPIAYSHGEYHALGRILGTFGYSVKKESRKKK